DETARLETLFEHDRSTRPERRHHRRDLRVDVEERHDAERGIFGREIDQLVADIAVVENVAVAEYDTLGMPRRARGVDHRSLVAGGEIGADKGCGFFHLGAEIFSGWVFFVLCGENDMFEFGEFRPNGLEYLSAVRRGNEYFRIRVVEDVFELIGF